jgi:soluble P-type ATPase
VLSILAAEPETQDDEMVVYPNPATRQITVTLASTAPYGLLVRLADSRGVMVRTAVLQRDGKNKAAVLDLSGLAGGTFFVIVGDDKTQQFRVRRIQKQ